MAENRFLLIITHAQTKRWHREAYYKLGEAGVLGPEERVELVEGEIVCKFAHDPPHAEPVTNLNMILVPLVGKTHLVRVQMPLDLDDWSQPEPDLAVVSRQGTRDAARHPRAADLIIEVAHSSVAYDRTEKASLYAKHQQPELWIVLVEAQRVEVCRDPQPDPDAPFGASYSTRFQMERNGSLSPLFAPEMRVLVENIFES